MNQSSSHLASRAHWLWVNNIWILGLLLAVGCSAKKIERGHGATGRLLNPIQQAETGVEMINILNDSQEAVLRIMEKPFQEAVTVTDFGKQSELLPKIEAVWNELQFAEVAPGERIRYLWELQTNLGKVQFFLFDEDRPWQVKALLALTKVGFFDNQVIEPVDGNGRIGSAVGEDLFSLPSLSFPRHQIVSDPKGIMLVPDLLQNQASGSRFVILLTEASAVSKSETKLSGTPFAQPNPEMLETVEKIAAAIQKGEKVVIEKATFEPRKIPLFPAPQKVNLPSRLTEQGFNPQEVDPEAAAPLG